MSHIKNEDILVMFACGVSPCLGNNIHNRVLHELCNPIWSAAESGWGASHDWRYHVDDKLKISWNELPLSTMAAVKLLCSRAAERCADDPANDD